MVSASFPCSALVRTTSRFTETPFSAPLISWAARPQICSSVASQSASVFTVVRESLTSLGVVRRGGHRDRLGGRRAVNFDGFHVRRDRGRRLADRQLVEQKPEFVVVGTRQRRLRRLGQVPEFS